MSTGSEFDVIVIGGGPIGLATTFHLIKRKARTLVLEQFTFSNQLGSSAGMSRQFRVPYPEEYMVKLVVQSAPFWEELQQFTKVSLLEKVGTLWFGDPTVHSSEGNIADAETAMAAQGVQFQKLGVLELQNTYRFRNLPAGYTGLFQSDGASINLRATEQVLLDQLSACPAVTLKAETPVISITQKDGKFIVTTPAGLFSAAKLVLTPGPFANSVFHLLGFHIQATYWNLASAYYRVTDPKISYPTWFVFQQPEGINGNEFYGFPQVSWDHPGFIRVASDFVIKSLQSPAQRTFVPNPRELAFTANWVRDHMTGLEPIPTFMSTCLVALSKIPNKELLVDFAPQYVPNGKNIVLYVTGWAGKFVPLLGRILSDLSLDGTTTFDISHFMNGAKYLLDMKLMSPDNF